MGMNTLHRLATVAVMGVAVVGCQDTMEPTSAKPAAEVPASPALDAAQAARAALALEDALTRLLPAAAAERSPLGGSLQELADMLASADAVSLNRQIARVLQAVDGQAMASADLDAMRLALGWVADAVAGGHADELN